MTLFDTFVVLHVVAAVIGFGSVAVSGVYGGTARHPERQESAEETQRYFRAPGRAELVLFLVPVFGAVALGLRPEGADFGAFWVISGLVVWTAASALLLAVVRPAEAAIRRAGTAADAAAGSRLMWAAAACDVLFVVALGLMITQPA